MPDTTLPAIFFGHGSPMIALQTNTVTETWQRMITFNPNKHEVGASSNEMREETVWRAVQVFSDHPWFVGVQFHPELKSRPFEPHPLFASFIQAAMAQSRLV